MTLTGARASRVTAPATARPNSRPPFAWRAVAALATFKLGLHTMVNALSPYGFHRDEFLYFAMGKYLAPWRMDFPPMIAFLANAVRVLLGDSLVAIRLVPALAGTTTLVLAALIARELGGGRGAQLLASLAVLSNSLFLRPSNLFQPVVLDQLCWTLGFFALIRLARHEPAEQGRDWLLLAAAAGLGLLTKFSIVFFGFAVFVALLVTPWRRSYVTPWPWVALGLALVIGSPSLVGQARLGFPVAGQMVELQATQLARVSVWGFLHFQLRLGPGTLLALVGVVSLLVVPALRRFRVVGIACLAAFVTLLVLRGKPYYVGPIYPTLFAAGAVAIGSIVARGWRLGLQGVTVTALVVYGLLRAPLGLPILDPMTMERYIARLAGQSAVTTNVGVVERLPQDYADMLGWEEQVAAVARVYDSLPPEDRARAVLLASNYGEAGAIDFFGPRYGLPRAVAFVGSYWFFGPGDLPGDVVVMLGFERDEVEDHCGLIEEAARLGHPYAVAEERDLKVLVCREPARTLQDIWPELEGEQ